MSAKKCFHCRKACVLEDFRLVRVAGFRDSGQEGTTAVDVTGKRSSGVLALQPCKSASTPLV